MRVLWARLNSTGTVLQYHTARCMGLRENLLILTLTQSSDRHHLSSPSSIVSRKSQLIILPRPLRVTLVHTPSRAWRPESKVIMERVKLNFCSESLIHVHGRMEVPNSPTNIFPMPPAMPLKFIDVSLYQNRCYSRFANRIHQQNANVLTYHVLMS